MCIPPSSIPFNIGLTSCVPKKVAVCISGSSKYIQYPFVVFSGVYARKNQSDRKHGTSYEVATVENYRSQSEDIDGSTIWRMDVVQTREIPFDNDFFRKTRIDFLFGFLKYQ